MSLNQVISHSISFPIQIHLQIEERALIDILNKKKYKCKY